MSTFLEPWYLDLVLPGGSWSTVDFQYDEYNTGKLTYAYYQTMGIKVIHHIPFAPAVGPIFSLSGDGKSSTIRKRVNSIMVGLLDGLPPYGRLELKLDPAIVDWRPIHWKGGYAQTTGYSARIASNRDIESIRFSYLQKVRTNIKKARQTCSLVSDCKIEDMYRLIRESLLRSGEQFTLSLDEFGRYIEVCQKKSVLYIAGAIDKTSKSLAAISICIKDGDLWYYIMGGYDTKYRQSKAHTLTIDAAIEHASSQRCGFDFEGSMKEGIASYFESFGAEPIPHHVITATPHPLMKMRKIIRG